MFKYIVKRVLLFIPTLIVISFLAFGLSKCTPGDPVENMMPDDMNHTERSYRQAAGRLGLDKPAFYVDFTATAYPDTLYKFVKKYKRKAIQKLIGQYGNWPLIEQYYLQINHFEDQLALLPGGVGEKARAKVLPELKLLETDFKDPSILNRLRRMENALQADSTVGNHALSGITALKQKYEAVKLNPSRGKLFIPAFRWYGFDNQYHHWAGKFLKGDFGISYMNGQPVATKIWSALKWTLLINGVAIFIAYLFSIPIGVIAATRQGKPFDRITSVALFMLHSLPSFWVATLLIVFFTTPEYGMDWFPTLGLGDIPTGASFWEVIRIRGWHMVLPVTAMVIGGFASLTMLTKNSFLDEIGNLSLEAQAKLDGELFVDAQPTTSAVEHVVVARAVREAGRQLPLEEAVFARVADSVRGRVQRHAVDALRQRHERAAHAHHAPGAEHRDLHQVERVALVHQLGARQRSAGGDAHQPEEQGQRSSH